MDDCWTILGLDGDLATERDVKAAYAKLLKRHRPDQDPGGFQRVRAAYEMACRILREGPGAAAPQMPLQGRPEAALPPQEMRLEPDNPGGARKPVEQRNLTAIRDAFASGDPEAVWEAVRNVVEAPSSQMEGGEGDCALLHEAAAKNAALLHQAVTKERLKRCVENGNGDLLTFMCEHWRRTKNPAAPPAVAKHLLAQRSLLPTLEGAMALVDLGVLTGFRHADIARKLADLAYPHLPPEARDSWLTLVEREIVLGRIFFGFPPEQLAFWLPRLRRPDSTWDWHGPEARAAFDYIIKARSFSWAGLPLLCQLLPPDIGKYLHDSVLYVASAAHDERAYGGGMPAGLSKGMKNGWLIIYGAGMFISIVGLVVKSVLPGMVEFFKDLFR